MACGRGVALGVPQRLAKAFHDRVFGRVDVEHVAQAVVLGPDPRGLVDTDLLGDGQMQ